MQQQQQSKATWVVGMESMHSIFLCALLLAAGYMDELNWEGWGGWILYVILPHPKIAKQTQDTVPPRSSIAAATCHY